MKTKYPTCSQIFRVPDEYQNKKVGRLKQNRPVGNNRDTRGEGLAAQNEEKEG